MFFIPFCPCLNVHDEVKVEEEIEQTVMDVAINVQSN